MPASLNATSPTTTPGGWRSTIVERDRLRAVSIRVGGRSVGRHAPRHVEREDHGALGSRQRDGRLRPGDGDDRARTNPATSRAPGSDARQRPAAGGRRRAGPGSGRRRRRNAAARRPPPLVDRPRRVARRAARAAGAAAAGGDAKRHAPAPPPQPALGRHAHDRPDEVVVGRQGHRVDAGPPERRARGPPRARSAASANRRRNAASWVSTSSCSPVSASSHDDGPTSGSSVSRGSTSRTASTSWRRLSRCERLLPARGADEVGDDDDHRAAADRAMGRPRTAAPRSVTGAARQARLGDAGRGRAAAPGRARRAAGMVRSTSLA